MCCAKLQHSEDAEDAVYGRDGYEYDRQRLRVELAHGGARGGCAPKLTPSWSSLAVVAADLQSPVPSKPAGLAWIRLRIAAGWNALRSSRMCFLASEPWRDCNLHVCSDVLVHSECMYL